MNYWICVVPKSQSYELVLCDMNQLLNYSTTYLRIRGDRENFSYLLAKLSPTDYEDLYNLIIKIITLLKSQNNLEQFLSSCHLSPNLQIGYTLLYQNYQKWSKDRNVLPLTKLQFESELLERGLTKVKNGKVFWLGISL